MVGKKVSPVLVDGVSSAAICRPDQREEVCDISEDERWRQLVRVLQGPASANSVKKRVRAPTVIGEVSMMGERFSGDYPASPAPLPSLMSRSARAAEYHHGIGGVRSSASMPTPPQTPV
jgi:hypothetical protein